MKYWEWKLELSVGNVHDVRQGHSEHGNCFSRTVNTGPPPRELNQYGNSTVSRSFDHSLGEELLFARPHHEGPFQVTLCYSTWRAHPQSASGQAFGQSQSGGGRGATSSETSGGPRLRGRSQSGC
jgi:hypothetical protein